MHTFDKRQRNFLGLQLHGKTVERVLLLEACEQGEVTR